MPGQNAFTENPVVLHVLDRYLPVTENWIYSQITGVKRYIASAVARKLENLDSFPFSNVHQCSRLIVDPKQPYERAINKAIESVFNLCTNRQASISRQYGASLLHAHFGPVGYGSIPLKLKTGLPLITAFYGQDACSLPEQSKQWRDRYSKLFEIGDLFLAEGSYMKETLVSLGCSPEKVVVQHLGIDLNLIPFQPRQPADDGMINVIVVGSFREKKGLLYAVQAFARVAHKRGNVRLVMVGDGLSARELEIKTRILQVIQEEKIADRVRITGYIQHPEFIEEALKAHICLQPSIKASDGDAEGGAPVCLIEMSASGLPVVATQHCDIPEVIINDQSGFLVPEHDVDALAERLLYLIDHPETWKSMAEAGRKHIEKNYDKLKQAEQLEDVYDRVLGSLTSK